MHFADRSLFLSPQTASAKAVAALCGRRATIDAAITMDTKRDPDTGFVERGWTARLIDTRTGRHVEWL
ncbi:hypothetical protein [Aquibium microcysteis]|uniref:hypothetical protein n=1 Tax=Aquibium microcysteis TaxID=675281 RepID=UPI00165CF0ED|nr:hypothetical protein [Aquibium microcysteis]